MTPSETALALDFLRQVLAKFTEVGPEKVVPEAELSSLNVDSLMMAEMLFEIEDRVGIQISEPATPPRTVADILVLMEPHLDLVRARVSA